MNKNEKKELIGLAALAAGIDSHIFTGWNPIDDDGDALKLAVKLELDIHQDDDKVLIWFWHASIKAVGIITIDVGGDRFAATRLAISEAAANIGRSINSEGELK